MCVVLTCVYAVKNISTGTSRVVNVNRLVPYSQRQTEQFPVVLDTLRWNLKLIVTLKSKMNVEHVEHDPNILVEKNLAENGTDLVPRRDHYQGQNIFRA